MVEKDYSGTPLYKKLGIKPEARVSFIDPPEGFLENLELPPGVEATSGTPGLDVVLMFCTRLKELRTRFDGFAESIFPNGGLWIAYPKRSSTIPTDLNFDNVQQVGLGAGLVDNKSCAVDDDYSGVRFVYRLTDR